MWRSETGAFNRDETGELERLSIEELTPLLRGMEPLTLLRALAELRLHNDLGRLPALMAEPVIAEKWLLFSRNRKDRIDDHGHAALLEKLAP